MTNLKDANLGFVVLKAIVDAGTAELKRLRTAHTNALVERYDEEGTKSFSVRLPGGELVATVTLKVPQDKFEYDDPDAFTAWLEANHKGSVDVEHIPGEPEHTVVVPATPDRVEKTIDPKRLTAIMEQFKAEGDKVIDQATGLYVDGVKNVPGGRPNQFAVTFEGDGQDQIAAAYRAGKLDQVVAGTTLPAVGGQVTVVERVLEAVPEIVDGDRGYRPETVVGRVDSVEDHPDGIHSKGKLLCKCMNASCPNDHYDQGEAPPHRRGDWDQDRADAVIAAFGVPAAGEEPFDPGSF